MILSLNIFPNFQSQPVSFGLCCIIWGGFVYFLLKRLQSKRNIKLAIQLIDEIEHSDIIGQLSKTVRQERKNTEKSRADIEEQFKVYIVKTIEQRTKTGLVTGALKKKNTPVGFTAISEHLRNILMSGLFASRLEAEALIKHTELKLFNESIRLKNILSSFIVIGLLGTLMGMSDSLGKFNDESINVTKLVSQDLPSAFIPSIWGVISTIVGMLFYSRLVHTYYTPLKTNLEHATLNSWIPQLCPAISDIIVDKLEDNARRIEKQFADAATVAEFARDVQKELAPFRDSIRKADQALNRVVPIIDESEAAVALLNNYADKLTRSADNFSSTLDKFSFLEERLALGYDALTAANETHSRQLSIWNSQFQALVEKNNAQAVRTDNQINNIFGALMDFDEQYLEVSKSQTEAVTELVKSVTAVKSSETALNREIAERILAESSIQFTQLIEGVKDLTTTLASNMAAVEKNLGEVDGTLKRSLEKMSVRVVESLSGIQQELRGGLTGVQAELAGGAGTPPAINKGQY
ncbi:MAG: MotA/TolQ/ExbB proton channel family protein [Desulfuromonadaceae bacterium]